MIISNDNKGIYKVSETEVEKIHQQDGDDLKNKEHYHDNHHFNKQGEHDDISNSEFSLKTHFKYSRKSLIFRITASGVVLALAFAVSLLDGLLEVFSINVGGISIETRIFDQIVIVASIPMLTLPFALLIGFVEPWLHFLVHSDHLPIQILLDSIGNSLVIIFFYFIYYLAFKISPYHIEPNKRKRIFKWFIPGLIIVPICALIYTSCFIVSLEITNNFDKNLSSSANQLSNVLLVVFFATLGIQVLRYLLVYSAFVFIDSVLKPVNHRFR